MTKEDILHHFQDINFYYGDCMMYADLSGMLDELISENKGEWILDETDNSVECNKCGCQIYPNDISHGETHFCPNCGADMRGGT